MAYDKLRYLVKGGAVLNAAYTRSRLRATVEWRMAVGARLLGFLGSLLVLAVDVGAQVTCSAHSDTEWPAHCKPTQRDCIWGDRADLVSLQSGPGAVSREPRIYLYSSRDSRS